MNRTDLVIIGGGATGSGIILEAASRGLRCTLLEKNDFSSGTTQASSRLIHGGIRYLEHFHFGLVTESLKERYWISRTFPHLLRPLAIHIPVYGRGKRSPIVAGIGVKLYDLLAGRMKIEKSRIYFSKGAREMVPEISHDGLSGLFVFHDYQILMPERLVLENIFAAQALGARCESYTQVKEIERAGAGYIVKASNGETGETLTIFADAVINAAGSWIDEVREKAGFRGRLLRPTKGVHIEVGKLTERALFVEAGTDRRLFYLLPFLNHTLIGTTDTDYRGSPDEVCPLPEDIRYLTDNVNRLLRGIRIDPPAIFSAYAGLRPLINVAGKKESEVPRRHRVVCEGPGGRFISITGGKLTTYRKMAEDTIKKTLKVLGKKMPGESGPARFPCAIPDPEDRERFTSHLASEYGVEKETASALYTVHGTGAEKLLEFAGNDPYLKSPLSRYTYEIPAQILYGYERESARRLEDIVLRRMLLGKSPTKGLDAEASLREVFSRYRGMSNREAEERIASFRNNLSRRFLLNRRNIK